MKAMSVLLLWFLSLSTTATAYTEASSETASVSPQETIVLTWTAPVQRENGSLLSPSELVGYQIYYTVEETGESTMIEIDDTRVDHYAFKNLAPGTYYFSVTAVDAKGKVSKLSELVEAQVR